VGQNKLSVDSQSNKIELISSAVYKALRWQNPTHAQILDDEAKQCLRYSHLLSSCQPENIFVTDSNGIDSAYPC